MFQHLLLVVAALQAAILFRLLRGDGGMQRGYSLVVAGVLVLAIVAIGRDERFLGVVAIAASTLTVLVPSALGHLSRWAFTRGHFRRVARLTQVRAILMPGSGLERQLPVLAGLAIMEREGVAAALAHFRELARVAEEEEDSVISAMIHEQIISTLFFDHRWSEGIDHFERRFHLGYAVLRPALALAMIRAYGESGRMDRAAGILRAMEEGPLGSDPRAAELLAQARLTFLAYAGQAGAVDRLIAEKRHRAVGVSPAAAVLFHGIALLRTGAADAARRRLQAVAELAGRGDWQVVHASRITLAELAELATSPAIDGVEAPEIEPELRRYAEAVARRLFECVAATAGGRRRGRTWMTWAIVAGLALAFGFANAIGGGGPGLLEAGAITPELWQAASRWRVLTAPWVHADLIGLLLDVYAVWFAGQVVERTQGWARMALPTLAGALAGVVAGMSLVPHLVPGPAGGNLLGVAAVVAGLWSLMPSRSPHLAGRARRNLLITLSVIFMAIVLSTLPGPYGQGASPVALLACILASSAASIGLPAEAPRWLARAVSVVAAALLTATAAATVAVVVEDEEAALRQLADQRCSQAGLELDLPVGFVPVTARLDAPTAVPIVEGFLDTLELAGGGMVQLGVVETGWEARETAWLAAAGPRASAFGLTAAGTLPAALDAAVAERPQQTRAHDLLVNGEVVARIVERRIAAAEGEQVVVLVASPPAALDDRVDAYARALTSARPRTEAAREESPACRP